MEEEAEALFDEYTKEQEAKEAASLAAEEEAEAPKKQRKRRKVHEYVCDSFLSFLQRKKDLAISRNQAKKLCALATKYHQALNTIADMCIVIAEYRKRKKLTKLDINCIENLCRVRFYTLIELNFKLYWEPKAPEAPKPEEQPKPEVPKPEPSQESTKEEIAERTADLLMPNALIGSIAQEIAKETPKTEPASQETPKAPESKYDISLPTPTAQANTISREVFNTSEPEGALKAEPTPETTEKSNVDPNLSFLSSNKSPEPEKPSEEPEKPHKKPKRKR